MKLLKRRKFVNRKKRMMYFSLFFMLLFISIGYAYLSATLSINGHTELSANTWNIHFENLAVTDGSVAASIPAAIQSDTTNIVYSVLLDRPGDFYEFEVDVVNSGTLPGKLSLFNIQGISSEAEPYLEHSIKYTNGNSVQVDDLLNPSSRKRIVVRVAYKEDLQSLPQDDIELDLVFYVTYTQTTELETNASNLLQNLAADNSCIYKYNGSVTDSVGQTTTASNVYFDNCEDKRNVIFGGFCWQVIRTTETGGLKIIYNGEPIDGKCESTRGDHKGIVGTKGVATAGFDNEYLYGQSFIYNILTDEFTLVDTETATWSDSTYKNLLGKFTCRNSTGTCTTLYNVNDYMNTTTPYISSYTIDDTNYAQIGTTPFNANYDSLAMVGYMYNKSFIGKSGSVLSGTNKFGSTFTYENGTYTISGTTQNLTTLNGSNINYTHYTCWNAVGTCNKISYIYYAGNALGFSLLISDGKSINDVINEMLYNNDVNSYNSTIKGTIDSWYAQNLSTKTKMLEDTVFCNARNTTNLGGWNPNGGNTTAYMYFKNYNMITDMTCSNLNDQFSVGNNRAKLTYPVGLLHSEEIANINYSPLTRTGEKWWLFSPSYIFAYGYSRIKIVVVNGTTSADDVRESHGVRPVVSLSPSTVISSGEGSEASPWIVKE